MYNIYITLIDLTTAGVDALYRKALELGAQDPEAPQQALPFFYGGYVRDPDGNKIGFVHLTEA